MKYIFLAILTTVVSLNANADMNILRDLNSVQIVSYAPSLTLSQKIAFSGLDELYGKRILILETEVINESKAILSILLEGKDIITATAFLREDLPGQPAWFELPLYSNSKTDVNCGPLHEETLIYSFETQNTLNLKSVQAISRTAPNCNDDNELDSIELFSVVNGLNID